MATINIGSLSFTHKGDYAGGTAYVLNDVVYYNGSAYIAKTSTTGNLPTSTAHWNLFSAGSGGIWNSGLSLGSANQVVAVNSGASALEFQDASSGKIGQVLQTVLQGDQSVNPGANTWAAFTNIVMTITPTATSSKIWIGFNGLLGQTNWSGLRIYRKIGSGSYSHLSAASGNASGNRNGALPVHGYSYNDTNTGRNFNVNYLDSPNTTDAVSYQLWGITHDSNHIFIGRSAGDSNNTAQVRTSTFMNAWEILA